jgi:cysteine desulfurase
MPNPIYMDHHATTPVLPEVFEAMAPFFTEKFGNPSSTTHVYGKAASDAVERARRSVADLIGARPSEIVSINLALRGAVDPGHRRGSRLISSVIEHEAVLETCRALEEEGCQVELLPVDGQGLVDPAAVERALDERTLLVSVQMANNEIGTIEPVAEIGRITAKRSVLLHSDAAQTVGRIPVDVNSLGVDLLSFSSHKMYGPKGIGALFVRRGTRLAAQATGGGQEKGRRSGTLNVPAIVGFGKAAEIASRDLAGEMERQRALRERLWKGISERLDHVHLNGHPTRRLPNNLNVTLEYVEGEAVLVALRDVAALSTGSACSSGALEGSYVIRALGAGDDEAQSSIRFGLGRSNTEAEVDLVVERLVHTVGRLRALSPDYEVQASGRAVGK